jgi:hypothetical protein
MKLGIQPDIMHKPKDAFEFASEHGFTHVEILMDHPLYSIENLGYAEILELKECYDVEVLIHAPATSTNFIVVCPFGIETSRTCFTRARSSLYIVKDVLVSPAYKILAQVRPSTKIINFLILTLQC